MVLTFDLPLSGRLPTDANSPTIQHIAQTCNVSISFKQVSKGKYWKGNDAKISIWLKIFKFTVYVLHVLWHNLLTIFLNLCSENCLLPKLVICPLTIIKGGGRYHNLFICFVLFQRPRAGNQTAVIRGSQQHISGIKVCMN